MLTFLLPLMMAVQPLGDAFPFVMPPFDDSATAISAADLSPEPAGAHGRLTIRDGHFVDGSGRRVRLFGTNFTFAGAFPTKEVATQRAARMKKLGFNAVRLHHMDNRGAPAGLWLDKNQTALDPQQMDRLDYLISQLKANGIYVDLNLHVSRTYAGFGLENLPRTFSYGKVIDHYHPQLIALQQQYATMLLGHRNPYTGLTYAEEPAIAIIELNNENTLLGHAFDPALAALPPALLQPLLDGWHQWLKQRYGTVDKLQAAWLAGIEPLGAENLLSNGDFAGDLAGWKLEAPKPAQATLTVVPGAGPDGAAALRATLTTPGTRDWDFQVHHPDLDLAEGKTYTVEFDARADTARSIGVGFRLQEPDWHFVGLNSNVALTPAWQHFRFAFAAQNVTPKKIRLSFNGNNAPGTFEVARVALHRGASLDLPAGGGIEAVGAPFAGGQKAQRRDWLAYLVDVERRYVETLRKTVKQDAGARAEVIDSQASYGGVGGVLREGTLSDFVDMHAYWQHPNFPRKPWDGKDWTIGNTPMVESAGGGTLANLAVHRVLGKPFTVSEYDHPAPSLYSSEELPLLASFAAFQDWDGLFQFDWGTEEANDRISGYFSLATHPGKLAFASLAARIFRAGLIPPAAAETVLEVPRDSVPDLLSQGGSMDSLWKQAGASPALFAQRRLAVKLVDGTGQPRLVGQPGQPVTDGCLTPQAAPLSWRAAPKDQALYVAEAPQAVVLSGRIGGRSVTAGPLTITLHPTARNDATVALVAADGQPLSRSKRMLLAISAAVTNQEMGWNETLTSVSNQWGHGPTVAEALTADLRLKPAAGGLVVRALDGTGAPKATVASTTGDGLQFKVEPTYQTLWYELATP